MTAAPEPPVALVLNAGSSTLKAALLRGTEVVARHATRLDVDAAPGAVGDAAVDAIDRLSSTARADVVGHRVVHGGAELDAPVLVDDGIVERLRRLVPLAPLHQPAALAVIDAARRRLPGVPHVACFDTAFHRRLPEVAQRLPLPDEWWAVGVRRYGFHGLSYEGVVEALGARLGRRAVAAHLGSGASAVALYEGAPVDTTMGLTPAGGLVMGTRPGDLDPGVVLYLLRSGRELPALEQIVERESGLLGLSGRSADVAELLEARAAGDARARLALAAFTRSASSHVGALATVLDGLDTLVFTGGIGEHSSAVRAEVSARLGHLGVRVDPTRNEAGARVISPDTAAVEVHVVPTHEEAVIARHAAGFAE